MKRRSGRNLLSEMENKFQEQIADLQERLIVLGVDIEEIHAVGGSGSPDPVEAAPSGD